MKKILMIAVAALAVASQAASVKWQVSSTTADGFAVGQSVLFFVGTADQTYTYGDATNLTLSDYVATLLADGVDKATDAAFDTATTIASRTGSILTNPKTLNVNYDAGTDIAGMIVVLDGNGKYNAFSLSTTVGAGDTQLNTGMSTATNPTQGFADLPGAVPEPATGALALAGIALLFRRRKA